MQIYYILKQSFQLIYFPQAWKLAKLIPILELKKNDTAPENYRLISPHSIHSKVYKKVIKEHIEQHLDKHSIIIDEQFGFQPNATIYQLLGVIEYSTTTYNKNRFVEIVLVSPGTRNIRFIVLIHFYKNLSIIFQFNLLLFKCICHNTNLRYVYR